MIFCKCFHCTFHHLKIVINIFVTQTEDRDKSVNTYVTESANPLKWGKNPSGYWQVRSTGKLEVTTGTWNAITTHLEISVTGHLGSCNWCYTSKQWKILVSGSKTKMNVLYLVVYNQPKQETEKTVLQAQVLERCGFLLVDSLFCLYPV